MSARESEKGTAYLLTIWGVLILSVVVGLALTRMDQGTGRARMAKERAEALAMADAVLARGAFALLDREERARLPKDGTPIEAVQSGYKTRLAIADERGRADLNSAPRDLLLAILERAGFTAARADETVTALIEARRPRRDSLDKAYPGLRHPGDLIAIADLSAQEFTALAPLVTVGTHSATIDPWAAPRTVLAAATNAPEDEIDAFLFARRTARTGALPESFGQGFLATGPGKRFRVTATAITPSGRAYAREAVIEVETQAGLKVVMTR